MNITKSNAGQCNKVYWMELDDLTIFQPLQYSYLLQGLLSLLLLVLLAPIFQSDNTHKHVRNIVVQSFLAPYMDIYQIHPNILGIHCYRLGSQWYL